MALVTENIGSGHISSIDYQAILVIEFFLELGSKAKMRVELTRVEMAANVNCVVSVRIIILIVE